MIVPDADQGRIYNCGVCNHLSNSQRSLEKHIQETHRPNHEENVNIDAGGSKDLEAEDLPPAVEVHISTEVESGQPATEELLHETDDAEEVTIDDETPDQEKNEVVMVMMKTQKWPAKVISRSEGKMKVQIFVKDKAPREVLEKDIFPFPPNTGIDGKSSMWKKAMAEANSFTSC